MTKIADHAERELYAAGLFNKDSDYGALIGKSVLAAAKEWGKVGHSGASHQIALAAFNKVINFEVLTPLTSDPNEWNDISDMCGKNNWQSKRQSNCFSADGGKTYYCQDELSAHYKCSKCSVAYSVLHSDSGTGEGDACSCGGTMKLITKGKSIADATKISEEPRCPPVGTE